MSSEAVQAFFGISALHCGKLMMGGVYSSRAAKSRPGLDFWCYFALGSATAPLLSPTSFTIQPIYLLYPWPAFFVFCQAKAVFRLQQAHYYFQGDLCQEVGGMLPISGEAYFSACFSGRNLAKVHQAEVVTLSKQQAFFGTTQSLWADREEMSGKPLTTQVLHDRS